MSNYRDRFTPVLRIYRLAKLSLLRSGTSQNLYSRLLIQQHRERPNHSSDPNFIRGARFFDPSKEGFCAVLDLDPTANLGHPHLYRVWQIHDDPVKQYMVEAEPFFHDFPIVYGDPGVVEIEADDPDPESEATQ